MKTALASALALVVLLSPAAFGQGGSLTPPVGPPAPTMKTLQEIWDKIGALETQNATLQAGQDQLRADHQRLTALLATSPVSLSWLITTVDSGTDTGEDVSLAFGADGQPAIAYCDLGTAGDANLKIARFDGTVWTTSVVESTGDVGYGTSLAFGPDGQPAISYYDATNQSVKVARFDGTDWAITTVNPTVGDDGIFPMVNHYTSLAFGPDGQPAIAYYLEVVPFGLNFARFDGTTWNDSTIFPARAIHVSLAFGPDGQPAIAFCDPGANQAKVLRFNGSIWIADFNADTNSAYTSLAFGPSGVSAMAYIRTGTSAIYRTYDGGSFTIGSFGSLGELALAFGPNGQPAVAEIGSTGGTNFATFNGAAWTFSVVDAAGGNAAQAGLHARRHVALKFGPDYQPAIAYRDAASGRLKFARKGVFTPGP